MNDVIITNSEELTPVQYIKECNLFLKREDLYKPFGNNTVNGGKLRQCYNLVNSIKDKYEGVISCCSIYSPQAPITSAVANHFNKKCVICYGATTNERIYQYRMPNICKHYGADIRIISKSGIHKILYNKAKDIAKQENLFVVDYGFNIIEYPDLIIDSISKQVKNIPDNLDNLIVTCGSGITTIGILIGLNLYNKQIKNIYLVCTAPNRNEKIKSTLQKYGYSAEYKMIDLFHQKGFKYEKGIKKNINSIVLHPNYEAKSYSWIEKNINKNEKSLFWIVGSKPLI